MASQIYMYLHVVFPMSEHQVIVYMYIENKIWKHCESEVIIIIINSYGPQWAIELWGRS